MPVNAIGGVRSTQTNHNRRLKSLENRFGDVLNYGADSTGTKDSTQAFNDALTASANTGVPAVVGAGTFSLESAVTMPANSVLEIGPGALIKIKKAFLINNGCRVIGLGLPEIRMTATAIASINDETAFYKSAAVSNFQISGMKFTSTGVSSCAIHIPYIGNSKVKFTDNDVDVSGATSGQTTAEAIIFINGNDAVVSRNFLNGGWRDQTFVSSGGFGGNNTGGGIKIENTGAGGGQFRVRVNDNTITTMWGAIYVDNTFDTEVRGNNVDTTGASALFVRATLNNIITRRTRITGNTLRNIGKTAIALDSNNSNGIAYDIVISQNEIEDIGQHDNGAAGIFVAENFVSSAYAEDTTSPGYSVIVHSNIIRQNVASSGGGADPFRITNMWRSTIQGNVVDWLDTGVSNVGSWSRDMRFTDNQMRSRNGTFSFTKIANLHVGGSNFDVRGAVAIDNQISSGIGLPMRFTGCDVINRRGSASMVSNGDTSFALVYTNNNSHGLYCITDNYFETKIKFNDGIGAAVINPIRTPPGIVGVINNNTLNYLDSSGGGANASIVPQIQMAGGFLSPVHGRYHPGTARFNFTSATATVDITVAVDTSTTRVWRAI